MDSNEEIAQELRKAFAALAARLTPDIEPAFQYVWREIRDFQNESDDEK
jgi:hypothetical protein